MYLLNELFFSCWFSQFTHWVERRGFEIEIYLLYQIITLDDQSEPYTGYPHSLRQPYGQV